MVMVVVGVENRGNYPETDLIFNPCPEKRRSAVLKPEIFSGEGSFCKAGHFCGGHKKVLIKKSPGRADSESAAGFERKGRKTTGNSENVAFKVSCQLFVFVLLTVCIVLKF